MAQFKKYRAIIAHCDPEEQHRISRILEETKLFEVLLTTYSGEECVRQSVLRQPDLVIADTVLAGIDGPEVLYQLKARCADTKVLILTGYHTFMENRHILGTADYCVITPYEDYILAARSVALMETPRPQFSVYLVNQFIADSLAVLGVPLRLKGYPYVSDGVQLTVYDPNVIRYHAGPNGLYAQLCRRHHETYKNLERSMRTVSDHIHKHAPLSVLEQYFTPADLSRERIPNLTLISALASKTICSLQAAQDQRLLIC